MGQMGDRTLASPSCDKEALSQVAAVKRGAEEAEEQ